MMIVYLLSSYVSGLAQSGTVGSSGDATTTYWVNDVGAQVSAIPLYKSKACGFWRAAGFDERFWLCD